MKKILLIAAMLFVSTFLFAQEKESSYIEVRAEVEKEYAPDEIYIRIVINEKDFKNKTLAQIEKDMFKTLAQAGVDTKKDLTITDMSSNLQKYILAKNEVKVMKEYLLLTNNAKSATKAIMALQSIGIFDVEIDRVECSKEDEYFDETMVEAVKKAKHKAELIAGALGQELGSASKVTESGHYSTNKNSDSRMRVAGLSVTAETTSVPDIEFEKIKITYSVNVRFLLK